VTNAASCCSPPKLKPSKTDRYELRLPCYIAANPVALFWLQEMVGDHATILVEYHFIGEAIVESRVAAWRDRSRAVAKEA
jgi:hypothetical protein